MKKLEEILAQFFTLLALLLAAGSLLAAPDRVRGPSPEACNDACCQLFYPCTTCNGLDQNVIDCTNGCNACQLTCKSCDDMCNDGCITISLGAIKCLAPACTEKVGCDLKCTAACKNKPCNDMGKNPKDHFCDTATNGCNCPG